MNRVLSEFSFSLVGLTTSIGQVLRYTTSFVLLQLHVHVEYCSERKAECYQQSSEPYDSVTPSNIRDIGQFELNENGTQRAHILQQRI